MHNSSLFNIVESSEDTRKIAGLVFGLLGMLLLLLLASFVLVKASYHYFRR